MCGIAGIVGDGDRRTVADMIVALRHRGPDGDGIVAPDGEPFALGHRRLAIIDLSPAGAQPMSDPTGRYWITYNGEVYNFREVRSELEKRGRAFRSKTDTEVVLAAYEAWGPACLDRLNGMFAFAIWDRTEKSLFAARDRLGIKPFYWAETKDGLIFASEAKAILASGRVSAEADPEVVHNPWHYPAAPRTGFRGIQKLPAGHTLTWKDGRTTVRRWWSVEARPRTVDWDEAAEELAGLLQDAVSRQMVSDVPIGALLSGGLDSSTIVALMQRHVRQPVHTFTITFRPGDRRLEAAEDDGRHARVVAGHLGCNHREIEVSPDVVDLLPKLVWHLDESIADPAAINTCLIAEAARQSGVLVLLNGMGADEIFAGYRKYRACLLADRYQAWVPGPARRVLEAVAHSVPVAGARSGFRTARWAKRFLGIASLPRIERFLLSDLSLQPEDYEQMYTDAALHPYPSLTEVRARQQSMGPEAGSYLTRMCLADTRVFLPDHNLTYMDKATMAAGVEARPPLIDHRIVEFAFRLPDRCRIHGGDQKALLRHVASRWLPRSVITRPKAPFGAPLRAWVRHDLSEMVDDMLSGDALRARGIYRPEAVRELIKEDREGREDHSHLVWNLLCREVWFRTFIDRPWRRDREQQPYALAAAPIAALTKSRSESPARHLGAGGRQRRTILALVQLPPPVHGVTVMNEEVVQSPALRRRFDLEVMPLRFAKSVADLGRLRLRKVGRAFGVACRLCARGLFDRPHLVYFTLVPVGGAFYRDLLLVGVLKALRIPVLFHLHGRGVRAAGRRPWNRVLYKWVFKHANVIHLSPRLYADIEEFVRTDRCFFVANGIPDPGEARVRRGRRGEGETVHLLFLSNMHLAKGPIVLLRALVELKRRGVPYRASFAGEWVGQACARQFTALVREHGLEGNVAYVGPKYGPEKDGLLAGADLLVFPAFSEAFPLVVLEAMSFALPVVSTNQGGIPDMVEDGVTGFLVSPGDERLLTDRLERLIRDPDLREAMGEAGRRRFLERFTREKFDERFCSILESIVPGVDEPIDSRPVVAATRGPS